MGLTSIIEKPLVVDGDRRRLVSARMLLALGAIFLGALPVQAQERDLASSYYHFSLARMYDLNEVPRSLRTSVSTPCDHTVDTTGTG